MKSKMRNISGYRAVIIGAVVVIAAIVALFIEENWRGKRIWEAYVQERIASGDALDNRSFEPPRVPDDQNFYKTPFLATKGYRDTNLTNPQFSCSWLCGDPNRALGSLPEGKRTKLSLYYEGIRSSVIYPAPPTPLEPAADIVRLFNQYPEIQELRTASLRPFSQCDGMTNYLSDPVPHYVAIRTLVQGFSIAAKAELDSGDCAGAATDARVVLKFADALRGNSTLVNRMIRMAVVGFYTQTFWDGWVDRRWTDKQYEEFQRSFLAINLFEDYDQAFRWEEWQVRHLMEEKGIGELFRAFQRTSSKATDLLAELPISAPRVWYYQNLISYLRAMDASRAGMIVQKKRYDPSLGAAADMRCQELLDGPRTSTVLLRIALPNFSKARETCIRQQAYVNQAAIVCALERFRHAQGHYPAALSELTPTFIDSVPRDVIGDRPLCYSLTDQGFRLYSVGMDATDDGARPPTNGTFSTHCDWVWMNPIADL